MAYATKLRLKKHQQCTVVVAKFDPPYETDGDYNKNVNKGNFEKSYCNALSSIASSALVQDFTTQQPTNSNPFVPSNMTTDAMGNSEDLFTAEQGQNPNTQQGFKPSFGGQLQQPKPEEIQLLKEPKPEGSQPINGKPQEIKPSGGQIQQPRVDGNQMFGETPQSQGPLSPEGQPLAQSQEISSGNSFKHSIANLD